MVLLVRRYIRCMKMAEYRSKCQAALIFSIHIEGYFSWQIPPNLYLIKSVLVFNTYSVILCRSKVDRTRCYRMSVIFLTPHSIDSVYVFLTIDRVRVLIFNKYTQFTENPRQASIYFFNLYFYFLFFLLVLFIQYRILFFFSIYFFWTSYDN